MKGKGRGGCEGGGSGRGVAKVVVMGEAKVVVMGGGGVENIKETKNTLIKNNTYFIKTAPMHHCVII